MSMELAENKSTVLKPDRKTPLNFSEANTKSILPIYVLSFLSPSWEKAISVIISFMAFSTTGLEYLVTYKNNLMARHIQGPGYLMAKCIHWPGIFSAFEYSLTRIIQWSMLFSGKEYSLARPLLWTCVFSEIHWPGVFSEQKYLFVISKYWHSDTRVISWTRIF